MNADILRCGSPSETWSREGQAPTSVMSRSNSISASAAELREKLLRPKSVPASLQKAAEERQLLSQMSRPHTAAGVQKLGCDRVFQVQHEPTRKHNLSASLPRRKNKTQPWQRQLDEPLAPQVVAPGYTLSKSKGKVTVQLEDDLFAAEMADRMGQSNYSPESADKQAARTIMRMPSLTDYGDGLVAQLQNQLADLQLFLEEERFSHRQTKIKAAETLKDKIRDMKMLHEEEMRKLEAEHDDELQQLEVQLHQQMTEEATNYQSTISKMHGEMEFLQSAFESYKSQMHTENVEKWKKREYDLKIAAEEELQQQLHQLRTHMIAEKNSEKAESNRDHQREIEGLRKEHRREMDSLLRRFSNAAADLEKLKKVQAELEKTKQELEETKQQYDETCIQVTELTRELTDTKLRLISFEQDFHQKVQNVDEKYKKQIHDLMSENTELRRAYNKKCGELMDEKVHTDSVRMERLQSAKDTMKDPRQESKCMYKRLHNASCDCQTQANFKVHLPQTRQWAINYSGTPEKVAHPYSTHHQIPATAYHHDTTQSSGQHCCSGCLHRQVDTPAKATSNKCSGNRIRQTHSYPICG